jgi:predicted transcriptional regulator of viral defense system
MQFIDFQNQLSVYPIFSLNDVLKVIPNFNRIQLDRWEKRGYLKKIKRGFYCFSAQDFNQNFLFYTANKIYAPSYISLEVALKYYGLIPEEIFQITSVSTKKAVNFATIIGNFNYRQIKPSLYWGYRLVDFGMQKLLLAEPEKAILDYLYSHPNLKTVEDFYGMRINIDEFKVQINFERFQKYLENFGSKQLKKRAKIFLTTIQNDNT